MLSAAWDGVTCVCGKVRQNWRPITVGVIAAGTAYLYFNGFDGDDTSSQPLSSSPEELARRAMRAHFEDTQSAASGLVLEWMPRLSERVVSLHNIDKIKGDLLAQRAGKLNLSPREVDALWAELKILSFTRTLTAVYAVNLLVVFFKIEVTILGRHLYLDKVVEGEAGPKTPAVIQQDKEIRKRFMNYVRHFLRDGLLALSERVRESVEAALSEVSLTESYEFDAVVDILADIRSRVESVAPGSDDTHPFVPFLMPARDADSSLSVDGDDVESRKLRLLVDEARERLASQDCSDVIGSGLEPLFKFLTSQINALFQPATPPADETGSSTSTSAGAANGVDAGGSAGSSDTPAASAAAGDTTTNTNDGASATAVGSEQEDGGSGGSGSGDGAEAEASPASTATSAETPPASPATTTATTATTTTTTTTTGAGTEPAAAAAASAEVVPFALPFVKLIPWVTVLAKHVLAAKDNVYVDASLTAVPLLDGLCVLIYSDLDRQAMFELDVERAVARATAAARSGIPPNALPVPGSAASGPPSLV